MFVHIIIIIHTSNLSIDAYPLLFRELPWFRRNAFFEDNDVDGNNYFSKYA